MPQVIADHDIVSIAVDIRKSKRSPVVRTFLHLATKETFCFKSIQNTQNFNMILQTDDVTWQVEKLLLVLSVD